MANEPIKGNSNMCTWNYRVVKRTYPAVGSGQDEDEFGIYEAYSGSDPDEEDDTAQTRVHGPDEYGPDEIETITVETVAPVGATLDELRDDLMHMLEALDKTVLPYDDFLGRKME